MKKVIYVPLDDRPCNYQYPLLLADITHDIQLIAPPFSLMGQCKKAADTEAIWEWLFQECRDADYAILSIDTLVYGNIIHSRIHQRSVEEIDRYLNNIAELKRRNPSMQIEAFNLVARVSAANDSFEDPEYWSTHGLRIWKYGWIEDRLQRGMASEEEQAEWEQLKSEIPAEYLRDFIERRHKDAYVNRRCIDFVADNTFSHLVIPKDDTAEYGYAATDQKFLTAYISQNHVQHRVMMYPGADEVGSVLFARVFHQVHQWNPRVLVRYSSILGPTIVPRYEDRPLGESIKAQITSLGGIVVDTAAESDVLFAVHSPGKIMEECALQRNRDLTYATHTCLPEFFRYIHYYADTYRKPVALADVAFSNGADIDMMDYAHQDGILDLLSAYGGWNTSENTNGMCLAHASIHAYYHHQGWHSDEQQRHSREFAARKIIEDYLFQAQAMIAVALEMPRRYPGYSPYFCEDIREDMAQYSGQVLQEKLAEVFDGKLFGHAVKLSGFSLPWNRVHELGFELTLES